MDRFSVVGYSAGAPYALACAYRFPERVRCVGLVSDVAGAGLMVRMLAGTVPRVTMPMFGRMFSSPQRAGRVLARLSGRWVPADRAALAQDGVQDLMAASLAEAFRGGPHGPALDAALLRHRWGFAPEQVTTATVHLWHGTEDHQVRPERARAASVVLPRCQPVFYPDDGHISVIVNHADEIVHALCDRRHA